MCRRKIAAIVPYLMLILDYKKFNTVPSVETEGNSDRKIRRSISGNPYFSNEVLDMRNGEVVNGDIDSHI